MEEEHRLGYVSIKEYEEVIGKYGEALAYINSLPKEADPKIRPPDCASIAALTSELKDKLGKGLPANAAEMENLLVTQAHALDALFNHVLQKSFLDTVNHIDAERLRVALLAQRQCGYTVNIMKKLEKKKKPVKKRKLFPRNELKELPS